MNLSRFSPLDLVAKAVTFVIQLVIAVALTCYFFEMSVKSAVLLLLALELVAVVIAFALRGRGPAIQARLAMIQARLGLG